MKRMFFSWLLLTGLLLCPTLTMADSFATVDQHPALLFEVPDYLQTVVYGDGVLCFEDIKADVTDDISQAWYGEFLSVIPIYTEEPLDPKDALDNIQSNQQNFLLHSIKVVNQLQAEAWAAGEDYYIITPGRSVFNLLPRYSEKAAVRTNKDLDQPDAYQNGIEYALCCLNIDYTWGTMENVQSGFFNDMFYWVFLYTTEVSTYAFTYLRGVPNNNMDYVDPDVERLFLSVRPKQKSEAEKFYDQYLVLIEQDLAGALEELEKAIAADPENALYYNQYAQALMALGRNDEAVNAMHTALEIAPQEPVLYSNLASHLHASGRSEEALEIIDRAIALAPDVALFHRSRSIFFEALGRYDETIEAVQAAIDLSPDDADNWMMLSEGLSGNGQYEEALDAIEKAIALRPNSLDFYWLASIILNTMGEYEKSMSLLDQAFAIDPNEAIFSNTSIGYANLYYCRYYVFTKLAQYEEALDAMEHALETMPTQEFYEYYADALLNAGQYEAVVEITTSLEASYAPEANYYALRAESLYCLEAFEQALEEVVAGMEIDNQVERLYSVGAETLMRLGRYEEALEMIDKGLIMYPEQERYLAIREKITIELSKPEEERGKGSPKVIITADSTVNLRSEGNAEGKILGKGQPGDEFPCTGVASSGWYEILLPDGQTAYVSNKMVQYEE